MQILNQYSLVFLSLFVLLGSIVAASLWFPGVVGLMVVLLVAVGFVVVGSVFQYQEYRCFQRHSAGRFDRQGAAGPVSRVLQFLSGLPFGPSHRRWD